MTVAVLGDVPVPFGQECDDEDIIILPYAPIMGDKPNQLWKNRRAKERAMVVALSIGIFN